MRLLELIGVKLLVMFRNIIEFARTVWRFYGKRSFRCVDLYLLRQYLFRNPYRICRRYLEEKGFEDPYLYGETPLTSMELIAKECGITDQDCVFELGCGRGRGCFWLRTWLGCRVVGIELVPKFVEIAQKVQQHCNLSDIEFRCGDMIDADYSGATVIYLYGTSFDDDLIEKLIEKFETLPKGTKIITVSYSLIEYAQQPLFNLTKIFQANFLWGKTELFLHTKN